MKNCINLTHKKYLYSQKIVSKTRNTRSCFDYQNWMYKYSIKLLN